MTVISPTASPFDAIKQVSEGGAEFWSARDLMPLMGYSTWQKFQTPLLRAMTAAENQGMAPEGNFNRSVKDSPGQRGPAQRDFHLSRFAAYLVAMNGDPNMPEVAAAQHYFAVKTREAEVAPVRELTGPELMAKALLEAQSTLEAKDAQIAQLEPKAEAFDGFIGAEGDYSFNQAAKLLQRRGVDTGQFKLVKLLEEWGWIYRGAAREPRAKQAQIDTKRLAEKTHWFIDQATGEKRAGRTAVRVTPKGIDDIHARIGGQQVMEVSA